MGLSQGDAVEVVGKNAAGTWLQITHPAGTEGRAWVSVAYVDLTDSLAAVPEVSAPPPPMAAMASPTPTPEFTGKLVFQVCNGCDIYVINADGSDQRPLFETAPSTESILSKAEGLRAGLDGLPIEYGFVAERMVSWTK